MTAEKMIAEEVGEQINKLYSEVLDFYEGSLEREKRFVEVLSLGGGERFDNPFHFARTAFEGVVVQLKLDLCQVLLRNLQERFVPNLPVDCREILTRMEGQHEKEFDALVICRYVQELCENAGAASLLVIRKEARRLLPPPWMFPERRTVEFEDIVEGKVLVLRKMVGDYEGKSGHSYSLGDTDDLGALEKLIWVMEGEDPVRVSAGRIFHFPSYGEGIFGRKEVDRAVVGGPVEWYQLYKKGTLRIAFNTEASADLVGRLLTETVHGGQ